MRACLSELVGSQVLVKSNSFRRPLSHSGFSETKEPVVGVAYDLATVRETRPDSQEAGQAGVFFYCAGLAASCAKQRDHAEAADQPRRLNRRTGTQTFGDKLNRLAVFQEGSGTETNGYDPYSNRWGGGCRRGACGSNDAERSELAQPDEEPVVRSRLCASGNQLQLNSCALSWDEESPGLDVTGVLPRSSPVRK
jgi:hypothetical protein